MEIYLVNTSSGFLIPETDLDHDAKSHLLIGETYKAEINLVRNAKFHRKFFKMIHTAWELLPERKKQAFYSEKKFRVYLEMTAGYSETFWSPKQREFVEGPASIAYDKLDQAGMEDLYMGVRNIIDTILSKDISRTTFEKYILPF